MLFSFRKFLFNIICFKLLLPLCYGDGYDAGKEKSKNLNCDLIISSDSSKNGTVTSPLYPSPYPYKSLCRYEFQGKGKEVVQIVFHDFNLFSPFGNLECDHQDSLDAFIYVGERMEKIDSFCGSVIPKPIMSNGPKLTLHFRSKLPPRYPRGFNATYCFTEDYGIKTGTQLSDFRCAFEYNSNKSKSGYFHTPNFPGSYPRDMECHYFFYGNTNERVRLHFTYFDVEGVLPCEPTSASDYVEFSGFMEIRDRKYEKHCGQFKNGFNVESDKRFLRVFFRSNDRLDGAGFNATYHFLDRVEVGRPSTTTNGVFKAFSKSLESVTAWLVVVLSPYLFKHFRPPIL